MAVKEVDVSGGGGDYGGGAKIGDRICAGANVGRYQPDRWGESLEFTRSSNGYRVAALDQAGGQRADMRSNATGGGADDVEDFHR